MIVIIYKIQTSYDKKVSNQKTCKTCKFAIIQIENLNFQILGLKFFFELQKRLNKKRARALKNC